MHQANMNEGKQITSKKKKFYKLASGYLKKTENKV